MGIALAIALATLFGAHVAIVVGLGLRREWVRALLALVVPPLAPWWGWASGMRARTLVWAGALAAYTLGVAIA